MVLLSPGIYHFKSAYCLKFKNIFPLTPQVWKPPPKADEEECPATVSDQSLAPQPRVTAAALSQTVAAAAFVSCTTHTNDKNAVFCIRTFSSNPTTTSLMMKAIVAAVRSSKRMSTITTWSLMLSTTKTVALWRTKTAKSLASVMIRCSAKRWTLFRPVAPNRCYSVQQKTFAAMAEGR